MCSTTILKYLKNCSCINEDFNSSSGGDRFCRECGSKWNKEIYDSFKDNSLPLISISCRSSEHQKHLNSFKNISALIRKDKEKIPPKRKFNKKATLKYDFKSLFQIPSQITPEPIFNGKGKVININLRKILSLGSNDGMWPPQRIRLAFNDIYKKFVFKQSTIPGIGFGLFAYKNFNKGDILGVYGGQFGKSNTAYVLQLGGEKKTYDHKWNSRQVEGTPSGLYDITVFGYINEYIWNDKVGNNVIFEDDGVIMAITNITKGQELFLSYGPSYDWSNVRTHILKRSIEAIVTTVNCLNFKSDTLDLISDILATWRDCSANDISLHSPFLVAAALETVVKGTAKKLNQLHGYLIFDYHQPPEEIIVQIILCEMFYTRTAFNEIKSTTQFDTEWCKKVTFNKATKSGYSFRSKPAVNYNEDRTEFFSGLAVSELGLRQSIKNFRITTPGLLVDLLNTGKTECDTLLEVPGVYDKPDIENSNEASLTSDNKHPLGLVDVFCNKSHSDTPSEIFNETLHTPLTDSDFKIACYNCNGLTVDKWKLIIAWMHHNQVDFMSLIDTRHIDKLLPTLNLWIRMLAEAKYIIKSIPIVKLKKEDRGIGGQIIIISTKLEVFSHKHVMEEGSLVESLFRFGRSNYRILSTYWPGNAVQKLDETRSDNVNDSCVNDSKINTGALLSKLKRYYNYPLEMLKEKIKDSLEKKDSSINLVIGDFNSDVNKSDTNQLQKFMYSIGMRHTANDSERKEPSFRSNCTRNKGSSRIDYAFIGNKLGQVKRSEIIQLQSYMADHSILVTTLSEQSPSAKFYVRSMPSLIDVNIRNEGIKEEYSKRLLDFKHHDLSPDLILKSLGSFSWKLAAKMSGKRSIKKIQGWSPGLMRINIALKAVVCIKRHVNGLKGYSKWTRSDYKAGMKKICSNWDYQLRRLKKLKEETVIPYPLQFWQAATWNDVKSESKKACKVLRKKLHGKERSRMRASINEIVKRREDFRKAGLLGKVIKPLMGTVRPPFAMQTLTVNGVVITESMDINITIKNKFYAWFKAQSKPDVELKPWMVPDTTKEEFTDKHKHANLPSWVSELLWKSMSVKEGAIDPTCNDLLSAPTVDELKAAIAHSKPFSTGGVSGLTNNMMKCWPESIIKIVYDSLITLWNERQIPTYWKWKWLVPIPKVKEPTIDDLRPLALVEVLRKSWISIFVRRIQKRWEKLEILENSQHGFRPGRGTDTAIANMINILESTKDFRTRIYISSWDLKKAFDSVPKDVLVWSWIRLGIPEELALYLVEMDFEGFTVVKTPLTATVIENKGTSGIEELDLQFVAELGCGQGDIPSPSNWIALFDMLLTALRMNDNKEFSMMGAYGSALAIDDVGYADDLIVTRGTLESMQGAADIISGFTILTGLTFSVGKFRAFAINWGNSRHSENAIIKIHSSNWVAEEINMPSDGAMKHLGVNWSMALDSSHMWVQAKETLRDICLCLESKAASMTSKKLAMTLSLYRKVGFYAKFMTGPLSKFRKLDTACNSLIKRITNNMLSFPNRLLYLSEKRGGLNYERFSDYVQRSKLAFWERMMIKDQHHANIMLGIASREARSNGDPIIPQSQLQLKGSKIEYEPWWLTSSLEWLDELNLKLVIPGIDLSKTSDAGLLDRLREVSDTEDITRYHSIGMTTVGDVLSENLHSNIQSEVRISSTRLRVGQCWLISPTTSTEILSFEQRNGIDGLYVQFWVPDISGKNIVLQDKLYLMEGKGHTASLGTKSLHWFPLTELGNGPMKQLFLSPEEHTSRGTFSKVESIKERILCIDKMTSTKVQSIKAAPGSTLYTDGSWSNTASFGNQFIGNNKFHAGGAVVERKENGQWIGYVTTSELGMYVSAFDMELMMLHLAIDMRTCNQLIRSDCVSAIKTVTSGKWGWKSAIGGVLRAAAAKMSGITNITHIAAHPERNKVRNCWEKWNDDERGIYLADLLAGGNHERFCQLTKSGPISIDVDNIVEMCANKAGYCLYWFNGKESIPFFGSIKELSDQCNLEKYLNEREAHQLNNEQAKIRSSEYKKRKWIGATVMAAASFVTKTAINPAGHAADIRLLWDKSMSGANYFRYGICTLEEALCKFCRGKLDSLSHKIAECQQIDCAEIRSSALTDFENKMLSLSKTSMKRIVTAMRLYITLLKQENSGQAWLGMWFGDQAIKIKNAIDMAQLTLKQFRILKNAIRKLSAEALKIARKHDEAVVIREIYEEQQQGLNPNELQQRVNRELSRGELQRRLNRRINVNKNRRWNNYEELGGANKQAKLKDTNEKDEQHRDNNELFMNILMEDPFEGGPRELNELRTPPKLGKRPPDWENWKKKKKKKI